MVTLMNVGCTEVAYVVPKILLLLAAQESPGSLLEMQILSPHPELLDKNQHFKRVQQVILCVTI